MTKPLPNLINVRALVERRAEVGGRCTVASLARFRSYLADDHGDIDVALSLGKEEGWSVIVGSIKGEVALQCQRCLEPFIWPINAAVALALVASEEEAATFSENSEASEVSGAYEPRIMTDAPFSLHELIEDELILAMPIVARHPEGACELRLPEEEMANTPVRINPFDVLAEIKAPEKKNH